MAIVSISVLPALCVISCVNLMVGRGGMQVSDMLAQRVSGIEITGITTTGDEHDDESGGGGMMGAGADSQAWRDEFQQMVSV